MGTPAPNLMSPLAKLIEMAESTKKIVEERQKQTAALIGDSIKEFLASVPQIKQLKWQQYTPYFNDGDECVFRIGEIGVYLEGEDLDESIYDMGAYISRDTQNRRPALTAEICELVRTFEGMLSHLQDELKFLFGNHVIVTATAEGVTVEEYENHD